MDANPPVEIVDHHVVGALERAAAVRGAGAVRPIPRTSAMCSASATMRGMGTGSMSCSTTSVSCSAGELARSTRSFGAHW